MSDLASEARKLQTLEEALRWGRSKEPPVVPLETIPQDEYTHDVVFKSRSDEFVVFDAT